MDENISLLESLPIETLTEVLLNFNIRLLQSLCLSSKRISEICNEDDEYLWKEN
ncbi:F-box domain-containing protein [Orpheovirus IHUMI-LCC2]|uniref:F-box domain-containing protein n=1 Tax=Orpheovirus IHUMI-LCC2 TaxID=2023057 RepID=A0A2I2L396_9VIRU|nr:F-box domain-containing protein [Orpheovirus IHUMI-LCC2]SNW62001.1 F-box domain-containing protein [Orpheovirus IHUMI-LCC2]